MGSYKGLYSTLECSCTTRRASSILPGCNLLWPSLNSVLLMDGRNTLANNFSSRASHIFRSRHGILVLTILLPLFVSARTVIICNYKNPEEKIHLAQSCSHSSSATEHVLGIWLRQSNAAKKAIGCMF